MSGQRPQGLYSLDLALVQAITAVDDSQAASPLPSLWPLRTLVCDSRLAKRLEHFTTRLNRLGFRVARVLYPRLNSHQMRLKGACCQLDFRPNQESVCLMPCQTAAVLICQRQGSLPPQFAASGFAQIWRKFRNPTVTERDQSSVEGGVPQGREQKTVVYV